MAVCSTTALRKYLTQRSNLGQPLREKAVSTTRGQAEGETLITSGAYRRPLFKSSITQSVFQVLTKRPERMRDAFADAGLPVLPNVWLGVSCGRSAYLNRLD